MATNESTVDIESVLNEQRKFPPAPEFSRRAHIKSLAEYEALYRRAAEDPEGFWKECAGELFWFKPFTKVLDWNFPLVEMVRRRRAQRLLQLYRSPSGGPASQQGRADLGGRAGRLADLDLSDAGQ